MAIETYFKDIADTIRAKAGTSGLITPAQMPAAIAAIQSGLETISRADWDALTTAQKQSKGLIGIIDSVSGFERGEIVNGSDYVPHILQYSNPNNIICEADYTMPFTNANKWGNGSNAASVNGCVKNADSVSVPANTGALCYIDLGAAQTPYTCYVVMKMNNPGTYTRIISAIANRSSGGGIIVYGPNIVISSYGSDVNTNIPSTSYFTMAIKYGTESGGYVLGSQFIPRYPTNSGRYITIARDDINAGGELGNADVKFFGCVNINEDLTTIQNNLAYLASVYLS